MQKFYTVSSAAKALGISKVKLSRKIRKHRLELPNVGTAKRPIYIVLPEQLKELDELV